MIHNTRKSFKAIIKTFLRVTNVINRTIKFLQQKNRTTILLCDEKLRSAKSPHSKLLQRTRFTPNVKTFVIGKFPSCTLLQSKFLSRTQLLEYSSVNLVQIFTFNPSLSWVNESLSPRLSTFYPYAFETPCFSTKDHTYFEGVQYYISSQILVTKINTIDQWQKVLHHKVVVQLYKPLKSKFVSLVMKNLRVNLKSWIWEQN